jgi:hypothetical protein
MEERSVLPLSADARVAGSSGRGNEVITRLRWALDGVGFLDPVRGLSNVLGEIGVVKPFSRLVAERIEPMCSFWGVITNVTPHGCRFPRGAGRRVEDDAGRDTCQSADDEPFPGVSHSISSEFYLYRSEFLVLVSLTPRVGSYQRYQRPRPPAPSPRATPKPINQAMNTTTATIQRA